MQTHHFSVAVCGSYASGCFAVFSYWSSFGVSQFEGVVFLEY